MSAGRSELERSVARVWADVLEVPEVAVTDDFFELGGNSIHAVRITSRTEELTGTLLSVRVVLESRTVTAMVDVLEETGTGSR